MSNNYAILTSCQHFGENLGFCSFPCNKFSIFFPQETPYFSITIRSPLNPKQLFTMVQELLFATAFHNNWFTDNNFFPLETWQLSAQNLPPERAWHLRHYSDELGDCQETVLCRFLAKSFAKLSHLLLWGTSFWRKRTRRKLWNSFMCVPCHTIQCWEQLSWRISFAWGITLITKGDFGNGNNRWNDTDNFFLAADRRIIIVDGNIWAIIAIVQLLQLPLDNCLLSHPE